MAFSSHTPAVRECVFVCAIFASGPGVCACVCDLWWSESLFVLGSVKNNASREN